MDDLPALALLEKSGFPRGERWSDTSWAQEIGEEDHCALVGGVNQGDGLGRGDGSPGPFARNVTLEADEARRTVPIAGAIACSASDDFADLLRVVVAPESRGRGLGAELVRMGLAWMAGKGAARALLEVRFDNTPAIALYRAFGFETVTIRHDYYGPGADAWVMERSLTEIPSEIMSPGNVFEKEAVGGMR